MTIGHAVTSNDELSTFLTLLARRLEMHNNDREWLMEAARRLTEQEGDSRA